MDTGKGIDVLNLFLTGGATNKIATASLGGMVSDHRVRGWESLFDKTIPGLQIENAFPASGLGECTLTVLADGTLRFSPPDGLAGLAVAVAEAQHKVVLGSDANKGVRVFREAGLPWNGLAEITFERVHEGVLSHSDVTDAQRVSGVTTYRALMLKAQGTVKAVKLWLPALTGAQAIFSLALETPVAGAIQTVADEFTAPTAVTFSTPTSEGTALLVGDLSSGDYVGVWVKREIPAAASVTAQELIELAVKYTYYQ